MDSIWNGALMSNRPILWVNVNFPTERRPKPQQIPERPWENESPRMNAAFPERRPATEEISGVIERVTFHNGDSGFCVLRVKARGQRDESCRLWLRED